MKRKRYIVPMLLLAITLIACNLGMKRDRDRDRDRGSREISEYEYFRLHSAATLNTEVAQRISEEFKQERITRAQYKKMMLRFENTRHAPRQQVAASMN